MSERITEAELRSFDPGPEPCGFDHGGFSYEEAHRLIVEVRRLRRLIVDSIPEYEYGQHALGAEARAISEERG